MVLMQTQHLVQAILAQPSPSGLTPMYQGRLTQSSVPGSLLELPSFPLLCSEMQCGMCWLRNRPSSALTPSHGPEAPQQGPAPPSYTLGCSVQRILAGAGKDPPGPGFS